VSEPLIDAETLAELRALEVGGMFATATIERDEATIAEDVPFSVQPASINAAGFRMQPAILGLAGGRAQHVGFMPWGTDVLEGDLIHSGGRSYAVEGVGDLLTSMGLALSEVRG
jgi:hypothetical protein